MYRMSPARWAVMLLATAMVACDSGTEPDAVEIELQVGSLTLEAVGDEAQLQAVVTGGSGPVQWTSLTPGVVTVTGGGLATAVAAGTATVRGAIGSAAAEGTVTVLPPVRIELSELAWITDAQGEQAMSVRVRNTGGRGHYRLEYWKVDPTGRHQRVLADGSDVDAPVGLDMVHRTFLLAEPADWVVARSREPRSLESFRTGCVRLDGGAVCPSDLPEQPEPVDSLLVTPGAAVMAVGDLVQYTARVYVNDVEVTDRPVTWSTPTPTVVSISETGLVRALSAGYGEVRAEAEGVSLSVGLTVMTPEPEPIVGSVSVHSPGGLPARLWTGQSWQFQARVRDQNGNVLSAWPVTWSVLDSTVVTVDADGRATALGPGRTYVQATTEGQTGSAEVRSWVHPHAAGGAEFVFRSTRSDTTAAQVPPSFYTTWTDSLGVEHPAFIAFHGGTLSLDWSGGSPSYEQRLTMRTYIYVPSLQLVEESEYVDSGSLTVFYDLYTGWHVYEMSSAITPGLTYLGRYSLPGELAVLQPVGAIPPMKFYFELQ